MPNTQIFDRKIQMKAFFQVIFLLILCSSFLTAAENGEVHIYIFKPDSSAYQGVTVKSGDVSATTDQSGFAMLNLPEGKQKITFLIEGKEVTEMNMTVIPLEITESILTLGEKKKQLKMDIISEEEEKKKVAAEDLDVGDKSGFMSGNVVDSKSGKPVADARIFVRGVNAEVKTGENGRFKIELPVGNYAISIIQSEYTSLTLEDLNVVENKTIEVTAELLPSAVELEGITVIDVKVTGGVAALVEERRESKKLVEIIGAEQMSKSGDSDAAAALKRVTGITVVDGKFIYVRGMGERYSQTLLNGMSLPSPIVDKRVIPLDLFPTDVIDSLVVQKTSSADKPGEYGGGIVQIRTKKIPEEMILDVSMSSTYNTESTGKTGLNHTFGGDYDWLGKDDGSREVLGGVHGTRIFENNAYNNFTDAEMIELGRNLPRTWTPTNTEIYPSGAMSLTYGDSFGKNTPIGVFSTFGYSNETSLRKQTNNVYSWQNTGPVLQKDSIGSRTTNEIDLNGMLSLGTTLKEDHDISVMGMMIRTTEKRSAERDYGYWIGQDTPVDKAYYLQWDEQQLLNYQFSGENRFIDDKLKFNWDYAISSVTSDRPGDRLYEIHVGNYKEDSSQENPMLIDIREVKEDLDDLALKLSYDFEAFGSKMTVTSGYSKSDMERTVDTRQIRFQHERLIQAYPVEGILFHEDTTFATANDISTTQVAGNVFAIDELGNPVAYDSSREVGAYFAMWDAEFGDGWEVNLGVRFEDTKTVFDPYNAAANEEDVSNTLPSFNLTYKGLENHQFRAGYGESVNRPALNELSEEGLQLEQGDPYTEGSQNLKTAVIQNYDLKWEYYLSQSDSLSVALFYKSIDAPIELFTSTGATDDLLLTFANAESAEIKGIEVDFRRSLLFLKEAWKDFYFATNFTFSEGEVEGFDASSTSTGAAFNVSQTRDFVGLAPIVGNLSIGYDNPDTGRNFNLLYNYVDERTFSSPRGALPSTFLDSYEQLDFVYAQKLHEKLKGKLKIQNILNSEYKILQNDREVQVYKKGVSISLGLSSSL